MADFAKFPRARLAAFLSQAVVPYAGLVVLFTGSQTLLGISPSGALRVSGFLAVAMYCSARLLIIVRPYSNWTPAAFVGISMTLSAVILVCLGQISSSRSLQFVILLTGAILTTALSRKLESPTFVFGRFNWKHLVLVGGCILPTVLSLMFFWSRWPIDEPGAWYLNSDAPSHESVASTLATVGPFQNLAVLGQGIRYHWLADALIGEFTLIADLPPYESLTRIFYIYTFVTLIFLAIGWASLIAKGRSAQVGVLAGLFGANFIPIGLSLSGSIAYTPFSPTLQLSLTFFIACSYLCIEFLKGDFGARVLPLLFVLAFGLCLCRLPTGVVFMLSALGISIILGLRKQSIARAMSLVAVVGFGGVAGAYLTLLPTSLGGGNSWNLSPNLEFAAALGLLFRGGVVGSLIAFVIVTLSICAAGTGALLLKANGANFILRTWLLAALAFGAVGLWLTEQAGSSQFSFITPGLVLLYMTSGAAICVAISESGILTNRAGRREILLLVAAAALVGFAIESCWLALSGFRYEGLARSLLPVLVVITAFLVALTLTRMKLFHRTANLRTLAIASLALLTISISGNLYAVVHHGVLTDAPFSLDKQLSVSRAEINAGLWVRRGTPEDAVFASNRICDLPKDLPPYCTSTNFPVSALAHRQALLEGHTYGVSLDLRQDATKVPWALERLQASTDFARDPSQASLQRLWDLGVRFYWLDLIFPHSSDLSAYSAVIFSNDRVKILKLKDPRTLVRE